MRSRGLALGMTALALLAGCSASFDLVVDDASSDAGSEEGGFASDAGPSDDGAASDAAAPEASRPDAAPLDDTSTPPADAGPTGEVTEVTFQQGVNAYAGATSVGISTYGGLGAVGEYNANGMTFGDGKNDWCTGLSIPPSPYDEIWLLRFGALAVPAGAKVLEATLTVWAYGNDTDKTLFLSGSYIARPWNQSTPITCEGCGSPVGFRYRDGPSAPWGALGASAEGVDVLAGKAFRIPESGAFELGYSPRPYSTHLAPDVVQGWMGDGPNHGLRIVAGVKGVHIGYVQPQRSVTADKPVTIRPKLTIRYTR